MTDKQGRAYTTHKKKKKKLSLCALHPTPAAEAIRTSNLPFKPTTKVSLRGRGRGEEGTTATPGAPKQQQHNTCLLPSAARETNASTATRRHHPGRPFHHRATRRLQLLDTQDRATPRETRTSVGVRGKGSDILLRIPAAAAAAAIAQVRAGRRGRSTVVVRHGRARKSGGLATRQGGLSTTVKGNGEKDINKADSNI